MANTPQAKKRAKQAEKRRLHNTSLKSRMRTSLKNVVKAIAAGDKSQAEQAYKIAVPLIDGMVSKGFIQKNKASRHKSRLNAHIKCM